MRVAPADLLAARIARVRAACAARELDALLLTSLPNIAYLTGFFASDAAVLISRDAVVLIGDSRYAESLRTRARACDLITPIVLPAGTSYDDGIVDRLTALHGARVGFEASHLTVARHAHLLRGLRASAEPARLEACDGVVEQGRATKDEWEVAILRDGAERLSGVAKCILPKALAGRTELDVAAEIDSALRRVGFARSAFDTIVASGPHAASPHARPGGRRIEPGDLVVLDFGGVLDGYCTDLSRTVVAGTPTARQQQVIDRVIEAQAAAFAAVRAGAAPESVDAAARATLAGYGWADAFTHGTGHGLGLEVHEAPRVSRARPTASEPPLGAGMVLTLEPGAYFPGWGGVRIEDDVLVMEKGAEWLTDAPRTL